MREGALVPEPPDPITRICATRVALVPLSGAAIAGLLEGRRDHAARRLGAAVPAGWPDADDRSLLELRLEDIRRDPAAEPWLLFAIVRREPVPLMVGHAGFHGAPGVNGRDLPAALELAYTVFAPSADAAMPGRPPLRSSTGHGRCTASGASWRPSPRATSRRRGW